MDWLLKIPTLSIHPDAASRDDVARMATEIMELRHMLFELRSRIDQLLKEDE